MEGIVVDKAQYILFLAPSESRHIKLLYMRKQKLKEAFIRDFCGYLRRSGISSMVDAGVRWHRHSVVIEDIGD